MSFFSKEKLKQLADNAKATTSRLQTQLQANLQSAQQQLQQQTSQLRTPGGELAPEIPPRGSPWKT